jgi:hypothetical protein
VRVTGSWESERPGCRVVHCLQVTVRTATREVIPRFSPVFLAFPWPFPINELQQPIGLAGSVAKSGYGGRLARRKRRESAREAELAARLAAKREQGTALELPRSRFASDDGAGRLFASI